MNGKFLVINVNFCLLIEFFFLKKEKKVEGGKYLEINVILVFIVERVSVMN